MWKMRYFSVSHLSPLKDPLRPSVTHLAKAKYISPDVRAYLQKCLATENQLKMLYKSNKLIIFFQIKPLRIKITSFFFCNVKLKDECCISRLAQHIKNPRETMYHTWRASYQIHAANEILHNFFQENGLRTLKLYPGFLQTVLHDSFSAQ